MKFKHVYQFKTVNSTNDEAKNFNENDTPFLVISENQLAGKGRLGNHWHSGKSNFYCSIGVTQEAMPFPIHFIPLVTALVLRDFIETMFQIETQIKWPNDILFKGKKLAGILIEKVDQLYIVGIGINLALSTAVKEQLNTVIDIREINGQKCDQTKIYTDFKNTVLALYNAYNDSEKIIKVWLNHCLYLGRLIHCRVGSKMLMGLFIGLGDSGQLLLEVDGEIEEIWSGEIIE